MAPNPDHRYFRISLSYATFGILVNSKDKVIEAAPIGRWMINKPLSTIMTWVERKRGKVESL